MPTTGKKAEVSLYFHVPFCKKKCPYCHFYVVPDREQLQDQYLAALEKEWHMIKHHLKEMEIVSIYFGGGTPSLLGPQKIGTILQWINKEYHLAHTCEITLEANPENVSRDKMQGFKSVGINRVSLGIQSLDTSLLQLLGREHSASKSVQAVYDTYEAGIHNISIDLMFELPHQDLGIWRATLDECVKLPITHLSLYNLVIEPFTAFHKRKKELSSKMPSDEIAKHMLDLAIEKLQDAGLMRYEISAFARKGFESKHNCGYWTARPFLGLGPSAFSYFDQKRFQNVANLARYCKSLEDGILPLDFEEKLPFPDNIKELLAVEIRLLKGVDLNDFILRHGPIPKEMDETLQKLCHKGWLKKIGSTYSLSAEGLLFYDSVAEEII